MEVDTSKKSLGHLNFGPYVAHYKAHPELIKGLLERGKPKVEGSGNLKLAGILDDQREYDTKDKEWFIKEFQPYIDDYVEGKCKWKNIKYSEPQWSKSFSLMSLWINYMKETEVNPEHTHSGMLTWVIYLKTPDIEEERKAFQGTGLGPGVIGFKYGEASFSEWAEHTFSYNPEPGFMWIFPSLVRHEVIPFRTPGTRVSVSGNLYFVHPDTKSMVNPETPVDEKI